ncbi:MAG: class C beta-lactamase-related serine hydrolase [Bacteroidetes bacterium]|nr:MAG: class C beta-lactamase-related serine hydrolase [Bacteroidota bacterium]
MAGRIPVIRYLASINEQGTMSIIKLSGSSSRSTASGMSAILLAWSALTLVVSESTAQSIKYSWPGESWEVSTPEDEGVDGVAIQAIIDEITAGEYGPIDHFLLIRNGRSIADQHFENDYESVMAQYDTTRHQYNYDDTNWHPFYNGTHLHSMQSVTKSVLSAALGIAIDEGYISSVNVKVMPYFSDYEFDRSDTRKMDIRLEDLLTMRSGIKWNTSGGYSDSDHSTIVMELSDEWMPFILNQPMYADPGTTYQYNDGASVMIGHILREATGKRADEWANDRLFRPIGIDEYYWKTTVSGEADTEGGLYLTTHDLARIGYLFLRNGNWNGTQVISEEWVKASISPVVVDINPDNQRIDPGYGYQWWVPLQKDGEPQIFAGNGYGGQFLMVAPEYDLIAVFDGWNIHGERFKQSWRALQDRIIPAVID